MATARLPRWSLRSLALLGTILPLAGPVAAQRADFLFQQPRVTIGVRGGWAVAQAGSEIFDHTTSILTVDRRDFDGFALQAELAVRLRERLDLTIAVGHTRAEIASEFRDWVDQDDLPIEQLTHFSRTPITVGVKGYLGERGRAVSRFAWVPYDWAPYISAGVGLMGYYFSQTGDFVDFETLDVFTATFRSEGIAPSAYLATGLDLSFGAHLLATGEVRYLWSRAEMNKTREVGMSWDFVDFDRIDLSGFQLGVGVGVRF